MTAFRTEGTNASTGESTGDDRRVDRRDVLRSLGGATAVALAGCTAPDAGDGEAAGSTDGDSSDRSETADGSSSDQSETADGGDGDDETGDGSLPETAAVDAVNTAFEPDLVRIRAGGTVTWTVGEGTHTVTAYHPDNDAAARIPSDAAAFDSAILNDGETHQHVFEVEGVYDYYCEPHEGTGMVASVIVGDPDPDGDEPGLAEPDDDVGAPDAIRTLNEAAIEELRRESTGENGGASEDSASEAGADEGATTDEDQDGQADTQREDGGDDEETDAAESDANDAGEPGAEVTIPGREFSPDLVSVDVGATVRWTFEDDSHTVTAYEDRIPADATPFDSGLRDQGDTFEATLEVEGVYDYYCSPHVGRGMVASVIVGDPDPDGDEPGLADPTGDGDEASALAALNARARERLGDGETSEAIDAETLADADGEIDIDVRADDGGVVSGESVPIVARFEGARLANAPVDVEGDFQGYTDDDGAFDVTVPRDLEPGEECRIEIRVDGARGRVEIPVDG